MAIKESNTFKVILSRSCLMAIPYGVCKWVIPDLYTMDSRSQLNGSATKERRPDTCATEAGHTLIVLGFIREI